VYESGRLVVPKLFVAPDRLEMTEGLSGPVDDCLCLITVNRMLKCSS
jgi:hypothetical protein